MPCYTPLSAYRSRTINPSGKRGITFTRADAYADMPLELPCGRCIGCRLERSRQWAIRCVHEAATHDDNCFITLTFNDENLNADGTLVKADFQKFMKRLRKKYPDKKIKYFHCGEYGAKNKRPHHHAILFGIDFKRVPKRLPGNKIVYTNPDLEKLWSIDGKKLGFVTVDDANFKTAAYVARYITKKIFGEMAVHYYNDIDYNTGEIRSSRIPEYTTCSRGIGKEFIEKYWENIYTHDEISMNGKLVQPPKYYDKYLEKVSPETYRKIKSKRKKRAEENPDYHDMRRLDEKHAIATKRHKQNNQRRYESS